MNAPTIIVPLDGTEHALVALPVARHLAQLDSAMLHVVHVARESAPPATILEQIGLTAGDLRGSVLDERTGEPAAGILQIAAEQQAALIVMCPRTAAQVEGKLLGGTARAVLEGARWPVILVPPDRGLVPWELRRILLPHDGTPSTSEAVRPAAELARRAGAELLVLHVAVPGARPPAEPGSMASPRYLDQPQHEWPAWTGEFLERLDCVCPLESLDVRMAVAPGEPGEEVLRVAGESNVDLIVLAWHGRWEEGHAETVKTIVARTTCPLMVIGEQFARDARG